MIHSGEVRPGDEFDAAVLDQAVIEGHPDGGIQRRLQHGRSAIVLILMPRRLTRARLFYEKVG